MLNDPLSLMSLIEKDKFIEYDKKPLWLKKHNNKNVKYRIENNSFEHPYDSIAWYDNIIMNSEKGLKDEEGIKYFTIDGNIRYFMCDNMIHDQKDIEKVRKEQDINQMKHLCTYDNNDAKDNAYHNTKYCKICGINMDKDIYNWSMIPQMNITYCILNTYDHINFGDYDYPRDFTTTTNDNDNNGILITYIKKPLNLSEMKDYIYYYIGNNKSNIGNSINDNYKSKGIIPFGLKRMLTKRLIKVYNNEYILRFDSNFESGNLLKIKYNKSYEYDLYLNDDTNTYGYAYWFYYSVCIDKLNDDDTINNNNNNTNTNTNTNQNQNDNDNDKSSNNKGTKNDCSNSNSNNNNNNNNTSVNENVNVNNKRKIIFNIKNCFKYDSLFHEGMRIMVYSYKENELNKNKGWEEACENITYTRNNYKNEIIIVANNNRNIIEEYNNHPDNDQHIDDLEYEYNIKNIHVNTKDNISPQPPPSSSSLSGNKTNTNNNNKDETTSIVNISSTSPTPITVNNNNNDINNINIPIEISSKQQDINDNLICDKNPNIDDTNSLYSDNNSHRSNHNQSVENINNNNNNEVGNNSEYNEKNIEYKNTNDNYTNNMNANNTEENNNNNTNKNKNENEYCITKKKVILYTLSFSYTFKHDYDKVLFAFSIPYTFTDLINCIRDIENSLQKHAIVNNPNQNNIDPINTNNTTASNRSNSQFQSILIRTTDVYYKREKICNTLAGLPVYMITITSNIIDTKDRETRLKYRKGIFLTSRVHAAEVNSSFVMQGILKYLVSNTEEARRLRSFFVFKLVPMINPDGVAFGNSRTSVSGADLNRKWHEPHERLHPSIYFTKEEIRKFHKEREILVFCDFHSHSTKKNSFIYGCNTAPDGGFCSWTKVRLFPRIFAKRSHMFSYNDCTFRVTPDRIGTARVVVWKEFKVTNSFTLETSAFGYDYGKTVKRFTPELLEKLGIDFLLSLLEYVVVLVGLTKELIITNGWLKPSKLMELTGKPASEILALKLKEEREEERRKLRMERLLLEQNEMILKRKRNRHMTINPLDLNLSKTNNTHNASMINIKFQEIDQPNKTDAKKILDEKDDLQNDNDNSPSIRKSQSNWMPKSDELKYLQDIASKYPTDKNVLPDLKNDWREYFDTKELQQNYDIIMQGHDPDELDNNKKCESDSSISNDCVDESKSHDILNEFSEDPSNSNIILQQLDEIQYIIDGDISQLTERKKRGDISLKNLNSASANDSHSKSKKMNIYAVDTYYNSLDISLISIQDKDKNVNCQTLQPRNYLNSKWDDLKDQWNYMNKKERDTISPKVNPSDLTRRSLLKAKITPITKNHQDQLQKHIPENQIDTKDKSPRIKLITLKESIIPHYKFNSLARPYRQMSPYNIEKNGINFDKMENHIHSKRDKEKFKFNEKDKANKEAVWISPLEIRLKQNEKFRLAKVINQGCEYEPYTTKNSNVIPMVIALDGKKRDIREYIKKLTIDNLKDQNKSIDSKDTSKYIDLEYDFSVTNSTICEEYYHYKRKLSPILPSFNMNKKEEELPKQKIKISQSKPLGMRIDPINNKEKNKYFESKILQKINDNIMIAESNSSSKPGLYSS